MRAKLHSVILAFITLLFILVAAALGTLVYIQRDNAEVDKRIALWQATTDLNTSDAYLNFAQVYPHHFRTKEAMGLYEQRLWEEAGSPATSTGISKYLKAFPNGAFSKGARERLAVIEAERQTQVMDEAIAKARTDSSLDIRQELVSLQAAIDANPNAQNLTAARSLLRDIQQKAEDLERYGDLQEPEIEPQRQAASEPRGPAQTARQSPFLSVDNNGVLPEDWALDQRFSFLKNAGGEIDYQNTGYEGLLDAYYSTSSPDIENCTDSRFEWCIKFSGRIKYASWVSHQQRVYFEFLAQYLTRYTNYWLLDNGGIFLINGTQYRVFSPKHVQQQYEYFEDWASRTSEFHQPLHFHPTPHDMHFHRFTLEEGDYHTHSDPAKANDPPLNGAEAMSDPDVYKRLLRADQGGVEGLREKSDSYNVNVDYFQERRLQNREDERRQEEARKRIQEETRAKDNAIIRQRQEQSLREHQAQVERQQEQRKREQEQRERDLARQQEQREQEQEQREREREAERNEIVTYECSRCGNNISRKKSSGFPSSSDGPACIDKYSNRKSSLHIWRQNG